nr:glycosyltransferase family 2 protein [uncultured Carboxylicivirga sp.]
MILSILIPTYNRVEFLRENLIILSRYIIDLKLNDEIEIIVSDNKSSDHTSQMLLDYSKQFSNKIITKFFSQDENIGLERNVLYVLSKAESDYIMYVGDDDYLDIEYLKNVVENLKSKKEIGVILPSYVKIALDGSILEGGRDVGLPSKFYLKGYKTTIRLSWRGHQLSGLVLKREGLYKAYCEFGITNIYPFIFMVAYSTLKYNSLHLTEFPVKVTQPGQDKKDWGYGNDGLLTEVFDNYFKLSMLSRFKRSILQFYFFYRQRWRILDYTPDKRREAVRVLSNNKGTYKFTILSIKVVIMLSQLKEMIKSRK